MHDKLIIRLETFCFVQYGLDWEKEAINDLIEKAVCEADKNGAKVVSLGLLNQVAHFLMNSEKVETLSSILQNSDVSYMSTCTAKF